MKITKSICVILMVVTLMAWPLKSNASLDILASIAMDVMELALTTGTEKSEESKKDFIPDNIKRNLEQLLNKKGNTLKVGDPENIVRIGINGLVLSYSGTYNDEKAIILFAATNSSKEGIMDIMKWAIVPEEMYISAINKGETKAFLIKRFPTVFSFSTATTADASTAP